MYAKQPKKMLIVNILEILRRHSDADHPLSQKDIVDYLEKDYDMIVDRKAVKRNLMNLIDFGYDIAYDDTSVRINKAGEEEVIYTNWYLRRELSDAELRLLIDSVLFSKHIPYSQCRGLIQKLEGLSSEHFHAKVRHVHNLPVDQPNNAQLFWTIEILDEAIEKGRKVSFRYGDYGTDKKMHPRIDSTGASRIYRVSPYQMVTANSRYYLIGNIEPHDNVSHYRVDRILDIQLLDEPAKPQRQLKGLEYGLDLPRHMAEHVYMFSGESRHVMMRTAPGMAGELIDWFGKGIAFTDIKDESMIAHITANLQAVRYWALQYATQVTVLEPKELAQLIKEDLQDALARYEQME